MTTRPEWKYGDQMTEMEFRLMIRGPIIKINPRRTLVGVDQTEEWLELGQLVGTGISWLKKPCHFFDKQNLFKFYPSGTRLVELTQEGWRANNNIREIDDWLETNEQERKEYERLKKKFEPT